MLLCTCVSPGLLRIILLWHCAPEVTSVNNNEQQWRPSLKLFFESHNKLKSKCRLSLLLYLNCQISLPDSNNNRSFSKCSHFIYLGESAARYLFARD